MDERVNVSLKREHAILLLKTITENFSSDGYEGAKVLVEICQSFEEAVGVIEEEE